MENLARMSQLFGVTVEALLNGDPAPAEARPAPPPDGAAAEAFLRAQRKVAGLRGGACAAFVGSFALLLALHPAPPKSLCPVSRKMSMQKDRGWVHLYPKQSGMSEPLPAAPIQNRLPPAQIHWA